MTALAVAAGSLPAWIEPTIQWCAWMFLAGVLIWTQHKRLAAQRERDEATKRIGELSPDRWPPKDALVVLVNRGGGHGLIVEDDKLSAHIQLCIFNRTPFSIKIADEKLKCTFQDTVGEIGTSHHKSLVTHEAIPPRGMLVHSLDEPNVHLVEGRAFGTLRDFACAKIRGSVTVKGPWGDPQRHDVSDSAWITVNNPRRQVPGADS